VRGRDVDVAQAVVLTAALVALVVRRPASVV
jgi:hypothetical protein